MNQLCHILEQNQQKISHFSVNHLDSGLNNAHKTAIRALNYLVIYTQKNKYCFISQQRLANHLRIQVRQLRNILMYLEKNGLIAYKQLTKVGGGWSTCLYTISHHLTSDRKKYSYWLPSLFKLSLSRLRSRFVYNKNTFRQEDCRQEDLKGIISTKKQTLEGVPNVRTYARVGELPITKSGVTNPLVGTQEVFFTKKEEGKREMKFTQDQLIQLKPFTQDVIKQAVDALYKAKDVRHQFAYLLMTCRAIEAKKNFPQMGKSELSSSAKAMYGSRYQTQEPPKREESFRRTDVEEEAMARLKARRERLYDAPNKWQEEAVMQKEEYLERVEIARQKFFKSITDAQQHQRNKSLSKGMHKDFDKWHNEFPVPQVILDQEKIEDGQRQFARNTSDSIHGIGMDADRRKQSEPNVPTSDSETYSGTTNS